MINVTKHYLDPNTFIGNHLFYFTKPFLNKTKKKLRYEKILGEAQEDARKEALKDSFNDEYDDEKCKHSLSNTVGCNKIKVLEK